jgi:hypothetical protein
VHQRHPQGRRVRRQARAEVLAIDAQERADGGEAGGALARIGRCDELADAAMVLCRVLLLEEVGQLGGGHRPVERRAGAEECEDARVSGWFGGAQAF